MKVFMVPGGVKVNVGVFWTLEMNTMSQILFTLLCSPPLFLSDVLTESEAVVEYSDGVVSGEECQCMIYNH